MIKKSSRQLWTEHVNDKVNKNTNLNLLKNVSCHGYSGIIFGIDPSLRGTGVAIIESKKNTCNFLFSKRLMFNSRIPFYDCLAKIYKEIDNIIKDYKPNCAAIEQTIFVQNYRIAQILGSVRGAIVVALASNAITICEYPPLRIKQAITGIGRASKEQIKRTIINLLSIDHDITYDEADALAVACCHAWTFSESKNPTI